ncbi:MAG TPA: carboxypeptidase-like regulatory domain-containing protein [Gemmatimonadaceae bacterium]|jgi:hypothetical protein|nr:carboxypeptidase-like regulatory domain-containing protein [Gemmatimonadaceae bacterium]
MHRTCVVAALAILASLPMPASPQGAALSPKQSHLQGQIVDSAGHPVRSAMIETGEPARATVSDEGGFFRLKNLPAGPITISVRHAGFVGSEFELRLPPDSTVGIGVKLMPDAEARAAATTRTDTAAHYDGSSMRLRVVSTDGQPVVHANVIVEGGIAQITDENGEITLGRGDHQLFTFNVRRLGYGPWFGKVDFPEASSSYTVTLTPVGRSLSTIVVSGERAIKSPLELSGFYDRWQMRQKGALSAVFIGPEELEFRHPSKVSDMLYGLNGVKMVRDKHGNANPYSTQIATMLGTMCRMAILIDGHEMPPGAPLDQYVNGTEAMAIEIYARGGNTPISMQAKDNMCGIVAIWTGSRKF